MAIFGNFSEGANRVVYLAREEARRMRHGYIGTEHLLLGLIGEEKSETSRAFREYGIELDVARDAVLELIGLGEVEPVMFSYSQKTKRVLELAMVDAGKCGYRLTEPRNIFIGMLNEGNGVGLLVLNKLGVHLPQLASDVLRREEAARPKTVVFDEQTKPFLSKYGVDLTQMAEEGKIDPVIGRQKETERVIQVLSRRKKNNPVLIGEPGVGKTAIAEGLSLRILTGDVPENMKNKRIIMLDLPSMIAGAKYRGEFEERLKSAMKELKDESGIILFIDEMHTIVGAGASEGSVDASNILKPVLARGEIQILGATTTDEYRKHIEKDSALERRLQPIMVEEPTVEESVEILRGLRTRYELHHALRISDEAIRAAADLSARYVNDRHLPDKAIDLIDEAASKIRMKNYRLPDAVRKLESERNSITKEKLDVVDRQNFERAAELRDRLKRLEEEIRTAREEWEKERKSSDLEVGYEDIAEIVSDWTGVPVTKMTEEESERLLKLEKILHERVVGQSQAVESVARAIRRSRVGLKEPNKPVGSFIFVGPTGVGKTYLAKALAEALFGDEEAMIRVDMSEYMEKHSVSKLIGSPPGYVGFDDGGQLTEQVRKKQYSVVLFDEIEKAHPDVFNALLQILDDGRLTDSKGRTVSFKNCVIIMTSNVGANMIAKKQTIGFSTAAAESDREYSKMKDTVQEELKSTFRPEFLNRVDEVIVFHSLTEAENLEIVSLMIGRLESRLGKLGLQVSITKKLAKHLAKEGFDKTYGARPLERTLRRMVEDPLAEAILKGTVNRDKPIQVDIDLRKGELKFKEK